MKRLMKVLVYIAGSVALSAYAANPVSQSESGLTTASWQALCPSISTGCTPANCQDGLTSACSRVLAATGIEAYLGVTVTNPTGMFVQQLTPIGGTSSANGPTITIAGAGAGPVTCGLFTTSGLLISPVSSGSFLAPPRIVPVMGGMGAATYSLASQFSTGALPASTNYYMICMGYSVISSVATNTPVTGITVQW